MRIRNKDMKMTMVLWALRNVLERLEGDDVDSKTLMEATDDLAHIVGYIEDQLKSTGERT